jgi:hypothetical protein
MILFIFNYKHLLILNIKKKIDSINSKSNSLHEIKIWKETINYDLNIWHSLIPITNTFAIKQSDFVIQSHKGLNQKLQTLKNDIFTKSAYFIMMNETACCSLYKQLKILKLILMASSFIKKTYNLIYQYVCF